MRHLSMIALSAVLIGFAPAAFALTATQKVEKEITTTAPDGTVTTKLIKAELVTPGEKIVYTLDIINTNDAAATDLVLAMPVPSDVKFIEGTAERPGTIVRYSADGGETFVARDALTLTSATGSRPATADDITHIQWQIAGPINVGASDAVSFKARLR
ncbi:hypothetical protein ACJ3XI_11975 [Litorimonas sp. RW-G-Af-16]|uniref:hypothetical protein n=1 Tax=Litorimonas sp. RW-G-Af-16 TaxID=3241168 RepID=UPI00390CB293